EQLNAEACRILETSTDAVAGRPLEQVPGTLAFARDVRAAIADGRSCLEHELTLERRFAEALVCDVAASPLLDGGGGDGAVVVLRDRTFGTALREAEAERARTAAFGQIAAGIAHEVKNPLGGIRGAAELIGRRAERERDRETAELIVREVDRIAGLLDDFMVFARGDTLQPGAVNLHRLLDEVLDLLAMDPLGGGVQVRREFDPSIPDLQADGDRLVQVFLNLGRNALQAMNGAGSLVIGTHLNLDQRVDVGDGERLPTVRVDFRDTGCGMDETTRARVGTPFFTTKSGGTGLGIALARHFVALHGGALSIQSNPGEGTTVSVRLPLRRSA
ncbi:MAG: ATP-binding protein, partial [Myxococcota bacterium]|nr:ATP-binding protein [Myxococcota bacterium]